MATTTSVPSTGLESDCDGSDLEASRFLQWLHEKVGEDPEAWVSGVEFCEERSVTLVLVEVIVQDLQSRGWLRTRSGVGVLPMVGFEPDGLAKAREQGRRHDDRALRERYAAEALLNWCHVQSHSGSCRIRDFLDSPYAFFSGRMLSTEDALTAVRYLKSSELLTSKDMECHGVGALVGLTHDGIECARYEGAISEYIDNRRLVQNPAPSTTLNVSGGTVQVTPEGTQVVQNIANYTFTLSPEQLVGVVRLLGSGLGLDEHRVQELVSSTQELEQAAGEDASQGRLQGIRERISGLLQASPDTVGGQLVSGLVAGVVENLVN